MTSSRLERFRQLTRRHGLWAAMARVLGRVAQRWAALEAGRLLWLEAAQVKRDSTAKGGFHFRFLTAEELPGFAADPVNELDVRFAERLRSGRNFCFAGFSGPQLAAYAWFALGSIEPEHCAGVGLSFPADVAYTYKGFTRPEFRGLGLYGQVTEKGFRALADRGVTKVLASVEWTNWASLKSCRRLGYVDLGPLVGLGRGRWRIVVPPKAARERGIRFGG
jgi:hypothetical protein